MRTRLAAALVATMLLALPAVGGARAAQHAVPAQQQACVGPVVDDFTSGKYHKELRSGQVTEPQTGSMLGGQRRTTFGVPSNQYDLPARLDIRPDKSLLIASSPYRAFHGLMAIWGLGTPIDADYLGPNPAASCYDRFRVHFAGSDLMLNVNMQVVAANTNNVVAQCGHNVPGQTAGGGFVVEFPFECFVVNAGPPPDFHHITQVRLLVQSGSAIAANDYAIAKVEAAKAPGCGLPICLPLP